MLPLLLMACLQQPPQPFLIRSIMKKDPAGFAVALKKATQYRVEHYGFIPDVTPRYGMTQTAPELSEDTTFMGLPVKLNSRILPALRCAESAIAAECPKYVPTRLSGLRLKNSYHTGEVSNHLFGIALDIDPERNPCCGCVPPWSDDPKCKKPSHSPLDRAELPECWVRTFEKYGFYWLGWDELEDTMHFEFLASP